MLARLRQVADELQLPFGERTMTFNSRLAQELGKWAEDQGRGDAFHQAVFLAYFQHGENIALKPVLLQICQAAGLDAAAARIVLDERSYREAVDRDWHRSRQMDITAVPTFVINGRQLVGAQSYTELESMVLSAGVGRRR
jgi:predicted DsbA family dithiol-disulfide isomerase